MKNDLQNKALHSHGHGYSGKDAADVENIFEVPLVRIVSSGIDCEPPAREKLLESYNARLKQHILAP